MKTKKLCELGTFKNGLNFSKSESIGSGCKILGVSNFENNTYIPIDTLEEINAALVKEDDLIADGDILFVRSNGNKSLVGRILLAKDITEKICFSGFCIRFRPNKSIINADYLYYMLKSRYCKKQYTPSLQTNITNLSQDTLGAVRIPILEGRTDGTNEATLLRTIDLIIYSNKCICDALNDLARTVYDYWFTQFDFPNAEGKPYRTSGGAMEWNEQLKREIPKGWKTGNLSDIAEITMGQSPEGSSYNENRQGMVFYQGCTDFGAYFPYPRVFTTAPARLAKAGDILISVRAPVGMLNIAMEDCCIGRGLAALKSKVGSQLYLYYTLMSLRRVFDWMDGNGTTFGSITKDILFEIKVVIPCKEMVERYELTVKPIEKQIRTMEQETRELTELRDWLLPMLMNGQAIVE